MKDYYKILGVKEEASDEEIRARWIELTKYYHPDLRKTEEGDGKIKEINEAYEILKDEPARFQYDFERDLKRSFTKKAHRRQERRMNIRKIVIPSGIVVLFLIAGVIILILRSGGVATPTGTEAKREALREIDKGSEKTVASRTPPVEIGSKAQSEGKAPMKIKEVVIPQESKREVMPPESKEMVSFRPPQSPSEVERESDRKKEPVREILPEPKVPARFEKEPPEKKEPESKGKLAPQVILKSEMPATKEVPREVPKETTKPVAKEIPKEVIQEAPKQVAKEIPKEVPKEIPIQVVREVPKELPKEVAKEVVQEVPKELPKEAPREVPREAPKEAATEVSKEIPKEAPKEVRKDAAKESPKDAPKEVARVTLHPGEILTIWTKGERVVSSRPSLLAKEEEVKQFFSNYVDRYNRKDVSGLLSFFSPKAIQNQTEDLETIGNLYTKFINQSQDLRYQIEGMKIEISQHRVDVRARFRVNQKSKKDGEEKVWKGNIRWVLVKEEGRLKIISLDYQNEKSP